MTVGEERMRGESKEKRKRGKGEKGGKGKGNDKGKGKANKARGKGNLRIISKCSKQDGMVGWLARACIVTFISENRITQQHVSREVWPSSKQWLRTVILHTTDRWPVNNGIYQKSLLPLLQREKYCIEISVSHRQYPSNGQSPGSSNCRTMR